MKNKFLIISLAMSGLVAGQQAWKNNNFICNYKCGYNQNEHGNTIHDPKCNVNLQYRMTYYLTKKDTCAAVSCDSLIKHKDYLCKHHTKLVVNGKGDFTVSRQWWE